MKRELFKKVYEPEGDALKIRVSDTLQTLRDEPARRMNMKKMMALALAAVLILAVAVALAAGLVFSEKADIGLAAQQALGEQYGITPEMYGFFEKELSADGKTVTFTGLLSMSERLGVYSVTFDGGRAKASWSHDGENVGDGLDSPVWDARLLGEAMARKAAGEEWYEILLPEEKWEINVTQEQAVQLARQAVEEEYGADALEGFALDHVSRHVDFDQMEEDGHGLLRYVVLFAKESGKTWEGYQIRLYADDGTVFESKHGMKTVEEAEPQESPVQSAEQTEPTESRQARAMAKISEEQARAIALEAVETTYNLTKTQVERLEYVWDYEAYPYGMLGDQPVISFWFWLAQSELSHAEGDGLYKVMVNVVSGAVEEIFYDSGLLGSG